MSKLLKKITATVMTAAICASILTACGTAPASSAVSSDNEESTVVATDFGNKPIVILSREDGSGTRGAFTELFKLSEKTGDTTIDNTTTSAQITNSTGVMMTTVAGNQNAIGYISLGSLDSTVKAVKVDAVEATTENVKSGAYKISRPFNIATKGNESDVTKDFIAFIASKEGQEIITTQKYIGVNDGATAFKTSGAEGKIVIAGSSSVSPLMEALKEAYVVLNSKATLEIQSSDSTTGMNSTVDGICDIGMASRELKDSEIEKGLVPVVIAQDGIAIVVNVNCPLEDIKSETVTSVYKGEMTTWAQILG